jgi:predicted Fe-Mo cluster-binding NifX family protein
MIDKSRQGKRSRRKETGEMRIVVSAQGENLDAPASPVFGRCPTYIFADTETMQFEALPNPAMNQGGGAGIQAAQFVVERGAQAVLTGNLGPNAFDVLQAAGVPGYLLPEGTVRQAVEAFKAGRLQPMGGASVQAHAGMGTRVGMGRGAGMGMGRGAGRGMGMPSRGGTQPPASAQPLPQAPPEPELAQLRETLKGLRQQLAETMERIEELEKEN